MFRGLLGERLCCDPGAFPDDPLHGQQEVETHQGRTAPATPATATHARRPFSGAAGAEEHHLVLVIVVEVDEVSPTPPAPTSCSKRVPGIQVGPAADSRCALGMVRQSPQPSGTRAQALMIR